MDERIAKLKTPQDARQMAENAERLGHSDVAIKALARARELQALADGYTSPAEQAIAIALYAYEEEQSRIKRRTSPAHRTRKMFVKYGPLGAAERMVLRRQPSEGFKVLEDAGLETFSFEAIIDRFPGEFSAEAVAAARARLTGAPPPSVPSQVRSTSIMRNDKPAAAPAPLKLDAEALAFLDGYQVTSSRYHTGWLGLPRFFGQICI